MTDQQLYLAIGVPILVNSTVLVAILLLVSGALNKRLDDLRSEMAQRFDGINQRFDDMRDLWRAELRRVEEVIDARLKHLEER